MSSSNVDEATTVHRDTSDIDSLCHDISPLRHSLALALFTKKIKFLDEHRKPKLRKYIAALALLALACLAALKDLAVDPRGIDYVPPGVTEDVPPASVPRQRGDASRALSIAQFRDPKTTATRAPAPGADAPAAGTARPPPGDFAVCGRAAGFHQASWAQQQKYDNCPKHDPRNRMLVLKRVAPYGETGNQLRTFLHGVQYARDKRVQLAVAHNSWAMKVILKFFLADGPVEGQKARLEKSLCVKILKNTGKRPRAVHQQPPHILFYYQSKASKEKYAASQLHTLRTLFQHYNTGTGHEGTGHNSTAVQDMCSGIDSLFTAGDSAPAGVGLEEDPRSAAVYSAIHLRSLNGIGRKMLAKTAKRTGCDPMAALEMRPEYVKAILGPLGLLAHPVVVITDGQKGSRAALDRLRGDPDIGSMIRVVPKEALWLGGDITLAVMANVFIGNPSSTMSGFIARSRVALGFGHSNYMYLARDEYGAWSRVHGVLGEEDYKAQPYS